MTKEEYDKIIENLRPEQIVNLMSVLGATVIEETDKYLLFATICHNTDESDASHKLYYYKDNHFFYCYTECGGMSVFNFLKRYYETRDKEYSWYDDIYRIVVDCSGFNIEDNFVSTKKEKKEIRYQRKEMPHLEYYNPGVLESFVKTYPGEWLSDGISKEAMDKFDIRYSINQNKIIIPHYDVNNKLIGVRGRALDPWEVENIGKYMPVQIEKIWYKHPLSLNLYGLNVNKQNIIDNGYVFLAEGEKACLQAESFSRPNCTVSVCGSNINLYQLKLLFKECHPKEIIVCFDNEEKEGQEEYFYKLYNMCQRYKNYCNFSFIYDREGLLQLKDSPFDKGEEVFEQLLEKRIRLYR